MKTLTPSYRPSAHPRRADTATLVVVLFVLTLFAVGLYFVTRRSAYAPQPMAGPRLGLALSGVLTSQLSLTEADFAFVRCAPAGFYAKSVSTLAPMGLELRFRSSRARKPNATYLLGAGVGSLTLKIVVDANGSSPTFSSRGGSVMRGADAFTFSASLTDAHGQPLLVGGRLECPDKPEER